MKSLPPVKTALDQMKEQFIERLKHSLLTNADAQMSIPEAIDENPFLRDLKQALKDKGWEVKIEDGTEASTTRWLKVTRP